MKLPGVGSQIVRAPLYDASGSITTGGTAQLVLGRSQSRSYLLLQNTSSSPLYFEFGGPRGTAVMTGTSPNQSVSSVTVNNAGFNYSLPPLIQFFGGGNAGNTAFTGLGQPNAWSPSNTAIATAVMTGSAPNQSVTSITVNSGGSGYAIAPYVFISNDPKDPNGCAVPSATSGIVLQTNGSLIMESSAVTTDPVAVYGATTGQTFICKYMD
jgi:hypothetical protein